MSCGYPAVQSLNLLVACGFIYAWRRRPWKQISGQFVFLEIDKLEHPAQPFDIIEERVHSHGFDFFAPSSTILTVSFVPRQCRFDG